MRWHGDRQLKIKQYYALKAYRKRARTLVAEAQRKYYTKQGLYRPAQQPDKGK